MHLIALALCARRAGAQPILEPSVALSVDTAYDSNVFNGRGPDSVTKISPRAALRLRTRRLHLEAAYDMGAWFYAEGTAKSSLNHQGSVDVQLRATRRLTVRVADQVIYANDPGYLLRVGVVAPQTSIFDNTLDAGLAARLARTVDGELAYTFRRTLFGPPPAGAAAPIDGDEHDAIGSVSVRLGRLDALRGAFRFAYYTANSASLAMTYSPTLAWRHRFAYPVELLEAGPLYYQVVDNSASLSPELAGSGLTWRGAALLRYYSPHWRASVTFVRDLVGGTGAAAVLWADQVYGQVGYHIAGRLDVRAGGGYFLNGFAPDQKTLYDGATADAFVDVWLVRGLQLSGYYAFRWQEAHPHDVGVAPLPSITRNIVGVRLSGVLGAEARPVRHAQEVEE